MKRMALLPVFSTLLLFFLAAQGQHPADRLPADQHPADMHPADLLPADRHPADSCRHPGRFRKAAGELVLAEALPFLFDRYITREDYAKISFQTLGYNLKPSSWAWDYDGFQTNQIGHPFHGSILYNSFRSNGYSFWQSVPAAFAGSYIWETFAENQAPSPNDFINTGFGGIILGEVTHRLTGKLLGHCGPAGRRQAAEVLSFLLDPAGGLTRITEGKWGRTGGPADNTPMKMEFDMGLRQYNVDGKSPLGDGHFGPYGRLRLQYGEPTEHMKEPFSHLSILVELGQDDSSKINIVSVYGSLAGWRVRMGSGTQVVALSANYEYIHNVAFFYSAQSIRANWYSDVILPYNSRFTASIGLGPVILAAVPDGYLYNTRNYDYGPGLALSGTARLSLGGILFSNINYRGGWMKTINGNRSDYFVHALSSEVGVRLLDHFLLCAETGYFNLHGNYQHYANVDRTYPYMRFSVRYSLPIP